MGKEKLAWSLAWLKNAGDASSVGSCLRTFILCHMEVINVLTGLILVGLVNYTLGNFGSIHFPNMSK